MRLIPLLLAFALVAPAPVLAQETIRPGEQRTGTLSADDPTLPNGTHYDIWRFRAQAGQRYWVHLTSDDFDAYAAVGPRVVPNCGFDCVEDDDNAGTTNALVDIVPTQSGLYEIRAGSYEAGSTGAYTVYLEEHGGYVEDTVLTTTVIDTITTAVGWAEVSSLLTDTLPRLYAGQAREGILEPATESAAVQPYHGWVYVGSVGETLEVAMESDEFDTVLRIYGEGARGWEELAFDDDGGAGTNSIVSLTLPADGTYVVVTAGFRADSRGRYTVLAEGDPAGEAATTLLPVSATTETTETTDTVVETPAAAPDPSQGVGTVYVRADSVQEAARPIRAGERVEGELHATDRQVLPGRNYVDLYSFRAREGEAVVIRMSSRDFDTYLRVGWWVNGTWESMDTDDDGGGGTDSELTFIAYDTGEFVIHARALYPGDTGRYTLSLERR